MRNGVICRKYGERVNWRITLRIRGYIQKFPDGVNNKINNNNKHLLRSNTKVYGGKTR